MQKLIAGLVLIFFLGMAPQSGLANSADLPQIVRLGSGEWPPYEGASLPNFGLTNYIVTEAFREAGMKVEYSFLPWKRSMQFAREGRLDGTFVWTKTPEREKDFYFSEVLLSQQTVFFHRKDFKLSWNRITDLKGLKIGVTVGYVYNPDLDKLLQADLISLKKNKKTDFFSLINNNPRDEMSLRQLASGKINIWPVEVPVAKTLMNKHLKGDDRKVLTYHPKPIKINSYHLLITKKNGLRSQKILTAFNKGLEKVKARMGHQWVTQPCIRPASEAKNLKEKEREFYKGLCP